jgi:predicted PurR-regulated permease PerM
MDQGRPGFVSRQLITIGLAAAAVTAFLFVWQCAAVLLVIFCGVLLAVLLRGCAGWVARWTRLPPRWAQAATDVGFLGLGIAAVALLLPSVSAEVEALTRKLPELWGRLEGWAGTSAIGRWVLEQRPTVQEISANGWGSLAKATGWIVSTVGLAFGAIVILFIGLFVSAQPSLYVDGALRLLPKARRRRVRAVLDECGATVRSWIVGMLVSMSLIITLDWVGLSLLGVPFALVFAVLAGLLNFIPNIGPFIAGVPAVLMGLAVSGKVALAVAALFAAVQMLESHVITPLVQMRAARLPPALTISSQILLGTLVGPIGIAVAAPLVAVAIVLVERLYVEDVLGDRVDGAAAPQS